jgi:hypothetical protein
MFRSRSNKKHYKVAVEQDSLAGNIAYRCIKAQLKASKFLQKKFETVPSFTKRLVVIIYCLTSFGSFIYVARYSFDKRPNKSIAIESIEVPTEIPHNNRRPSISKEEFEKIQKFKGYLDSLVNSKPGKRLHDSIIANRSGLLDSLSIVEHLYQSQSPIK